MLQTINNIARSDERRSSTGSNLFIDNLLGGVRTQSIVVYRLLHKFHMYKRTTGKKSQYEEDTRASFDLAGKREGAREGPSSRSLCGCA